MQHVAVAAFSLVTDWDVVLPPVAVPLFLWGTMRAGAAVDLFREFGRVAEFMRVAEAALIPAGVGADGCWDRLRCDDSQGFIAQTLGSRFIKRHREIASTASVVKTPS